MVYLGLVYLAFHNEGHYGEAGDLVYGDDNMVGDLVCDNMVGDLVCNNMVGKQVCNNMMDELGYSNNNITGDHYSNNTVAVGNISH